MPLTDFDQWYADQRPRVYVSMLALTRNADLATDVTDEAFLRAVAHWKRVRAMESPGGWTQRVALNMLRRRQRRRRFEARVLPLARPPDRHDRRVSGAREDGEGRARRRRRRRRTRPGSAASTTEIVETTRARAFPLLGGSVTNLASHIYIVQVIGTFVCDECSRPEGAAAPRGRALHVEFDVTGTGYGFGLGADPFDFSTLGTVYRFPLQP